MRNARLFAPLLLVFVISAAAHAETGQALQANVGDKLFVSDDDSIALIPVDDHFTLVALSAGASDWPPPKTPIDRLAIGCDGYTEGQTLRLTAQDFRRGECFVTYSVGHRGMGEPADAEYALDGSFDGNRFEITAANGKVIEGSFTFQHQGCCR